MKKKNIEVKQVGNFVVSYRTPGEVTLSWKGMISTIAAQMLTHEMVDGFLSPTGTFCDLPFEGFNYVGINYRIPLFMSRKKLEYLLMNAE